MKTRINLLAVLAIITLALSSFAPAFLAQSNKPISTKELKVLLKTAKEPAEHGRIAQYYRQQSADLNASSAAHLRTALTYEEARAHGGALSAKDWWTRSNPANHCRAYAESDAKKAKKAESLASLHEQMAEVAEQRRP